MAEKRYLDKDKQTQRFSIRKLTIGVASVMIGAFWLVSASPNKVEASTISPVRDETETQKDSQNVEQEKQEAAAAVKQNVQGAENIDEKNVEHKEQTIKYHEEGTEKQLANDQTQEADFVSYNKKGKITITYRDETTGKDLAIDQVNGYVGVKSNYSTANSIQEYENEGYVFVSDNYPTDPEFAQYMDDDQNFTINFEHRSTPIIPVTPINPGMPINPANPSMMFLSMRDVDHDQVVRHTINDDNTEGATKYYAVVSGGKVIRQDLTEDQVKYTFADTPSPKIKGYHFVKPEDDATVTGGHIQLGSPERWAYTVYYTRDRQHAKVVYVDQDDNGHEITNSGDLTGYSNDPINYSTAKTISSLENKGYELVNNNYPADAKFNDDSSKGRIFTVTLKHGTVTVDKDHPQKPGTPINPNDPAGPKYPADIGDITVTGKQTIKYTGAGDKTPGEKTYTIEFNKTVVIDKVTGKVISSNWDHESHTFGSHRNPVVTGYVTNNKEAGGKTVTPDKPEASVVVSYQAVGHIIPVDENNTPLPGAERPQYRNDPDDPTKVITTLAPNVPGYTESKKSVNPTIPTKDTEVVYTEIPADNPDESTDNSTPPANGAKKDKDASKNDPKQDPKKPEVTKKKKVVKKSKKTKHTKKNGKVQKNISYYNNGPVRSEHDKYYRNNGPVHSENESYYSSNNLPLSQTMMSGNGSQSARLNGNSPVKSGADRLPQTGEKDNKLGIIGLLTASLAGLFGLGEKKKRKE